MTTLIHLSDIHFGDACAERLEAARRAIEAIKPDCIIMSGDLTQQGKRTEFAQAAAWFQTINAPIVGCPGNHDTPMFNLILRLANPFGRFDHLGLLSGWRSSDGSVQIEAGNSARGLQWRMDWSQGDYGQAGVLAALEKLNRSTAQHRILVLHHPPETPHGAAVTSQPIGLARFNQSTRADRVDLLLCGHVHAAFDFASGALGGVRVMTAPSLASSRQRGYGSGFSVIRLRADPPSMTRTLWRFDSGTFSEVAPASEGICDIARRDQGAAAR